MCYKVANGLQPLLSSKASCLLRRRLQPLLCGGIANGIMPHGIQFFSNVCSQPTYRQR